MDSGPSTSRETPFKKRRIESVRLDDQNFSENRKWKKEILAFPLTIEMMRIYMRSTIMFLAATMEELEEQPVTQNLRTFFKGKNLFLWDNRNS